MASFASDKLLGAALGGLLALAPACASKNPGEPAADSGQSQDATDLVDASPFLDAALADAALDASSDAPLDAAPDAPVDASLACPSGVSDAAEITSSEVVFGLTLQQFTDECTQRGGAVEIEPHCGGENSCRGMSYDTNTQTLTEHTCKGMNTCAGYSCIICDQD